MPGHTSLLLRRRPSWFLSCCTAWSVLGLIAAGCTGQPLVGGPPITMDGGGGCSPTEIECAGSCIDPTLDPRHCGGCGMACETGASCVDGACVVSCPVGQLLCSTGCVDPDVDLDHCGDCDVVCAAGEVCASGVCGRDLRHLDAVRAGG
jgi:hypothetical protein